MRDCSRADAGGGVDGGYRLAHDPRDSITLAEVVGAIEGRVVDVRATQADDGLDASSIWMSVGEGVERALATISLAELLDMDADGAG